VSIDKSRQDKMCIYVECFVFLLQNVVCTELLCIKKLSAHVTFISLLLVFHFLFLLIIYDKQKTNKHSNLIIHSYLCDNILHIHFFIHYICFVFHYTSNFLIILIQYYINFCFVTCHIKKKNIKCAIICHLLTPSFRKARTEPPLFTFLGKICDLYICNIHSTYTKSCLFLFVYKHVFVCPSKICVQYNVRWYITFVLN